MHEASIVRELVRTAEERLTAGQRVRTLHVSVGLLTGVSPDALRFCFDAMKDESLGPQAELDVRLEPLRGRCTHCGRSFHSRETVWLCPSCGRPCVIFENGDELELRSLVVEDGEPDHDRTEDPEEERRYCG